MEQIKLHKQGGAAVIIIPASMIENTDREDGTLLDVLEEINEALHIRRKTESGALATKACPSLFSSGYPGMLTTIKSLDIIAD
ncbi:hypothetical protein ACLBR5_31150 [Escherichia coli]